MTRRASRTSPSREVVLDAALAVIDREGLDGLTIRALARELGKPPMTLYSYFRSKGELLDLTYERLVHKLLGAGRHVTWQAQFEDACPRLREVLREHPNWVQLIPRANLTVGVLKVYERLFGPMLRDGFSAEAVLFGFHTLLFHALGSALVEQMMSGKLPTPQERHEIADRMLAETSRKSYPHVAAISPNFEGWSFDGVFAFGLQSLIRGLDESAPRCESQRRETRAESPRPTRARRFGGHTGSTGE